MQLPDVIGDKLGALGAAITAQSVRPFLLKTVLGLLVVAMVWPYLVDVWYMLREAFERATDGVRARQTAARTVVHER